MVAHFHYTNHFYFYQPRFFTKKLNHFIYAVAHVKITSKHKNDKKIKKIKRLCLLLII